MARENIDLNSPDATKVRGGSTSTARSGKVDSFISSAKAYFGAGSDTADIPASNNLETSRSVKQNRVFKKFAGKQLHVQHDASVATPVNRREKNGRPTLRTSNVYDQFKADHAAAIKSDMMQDDPHQES